MKQQINILIKGIIAGLLIGMACIISIQAIYPPLIFSVGLICIVLSNNLLYTGYIGNNKIFTLKTLLILIGNFIGILLALTYTYFIDITIFQQIILRKISEPLIQSFLSSIFCGMLMCAATALNKSKNIFIIIICVAAFLIGGFNHCIANMFYFGIGGFNINEIIRLILSIIGNTIGAKLIYKWSK